MALEIERKFLVKASSIPSLPPGTTYEQFYLSSDPWVRVRIISGKRAGAVPTAKLTIKGEGTLSRAEFEYDIPVEDARAMLALAPDKGAKTLRKVRYKIQVGAHTWEVDQFFSPFTDFWLAEVELSSEDEEFETPRWATQEVTHDPRYSNAQLLEYGVPK